MPGRAWEHIDPAAVAGGTVDRQALDVALTPDYRATAEDRGIEVIEGARARRCRIAVDGPTFAAAFPETAWLVGPADLHRWRGQLDYWVFLDGELGQVAGSANGEASQIVPGRAQRHDRPAPDRDGAWPRLTPLSSGAMTIDDEREPYATKRDRLARLTRLVSILQAHPEGIRTADIATRVGMSVRTVYRDLVALQEELRLPVWGEDGVWGIDSEKAFLPPLKLTQQEAMAVVLSARLMVRYADKYDPDLAAAFEKLERGLPSPLAEHVERTLDGLSKAPRDERFSANVRLLTRAWAERRVVSIDYAPANYEAGAAPRRATVRPYLLEPSLQTHALYLIGFDEERGALRTFKIERIGAAALTPRTFEPPDPAATTSALRAAWDIIADQPPVEVVLRFAPGVAESCAARRPGTRPRRSRPSRTGRCAGGRRSRAPIEIRLWILPVGRRRRGRGARLAARRCRRHASPGGRPLR